MQLDGSVVPCMINAVTLALSDASIPMKDLVVASCAGHLTGSVIGCDLTESEERDNLSKIMVACIGLGDSQNLVSLSAEQALHGTESIGSALDGTDVHEQVEECENQKRKPTREKILLLDSSESKIRDMKDFRKLTEKAIEGCRTIREEIRQCLLRGCCKAFEKRQSARAAIRKL